MSAEPGPEPTLARFARLLAADPVPLGEAALVVAAHLGRAPDVGADLARLQALADGVEGDDLDAVVRHLFHVEGFRGDQTTYYDPANSMLTAVLDRRRGIPISLAVVAVDVARRRGVAASVVGMPGHVLIGDGDPPRRWVDGFDGGRWLDEAGATARFVALHGDRAPFDPRYLLATPDQGVLTRILNNLVGSYGRLGDAHRLVRVHELRAAIPDVADHERPARASALAAVGRYGEAAALWDAEASRRSGEAAEEAAAQARLLRAHLN